MTLIKTHEITPSSIMSGSETFQSYCALDCMVTLEVREELGLQYGQPPQIYSFERALQAPYLEIMQRGFKVDEYARGQAVEELRLRLGVINSVLQEFAIAAWGKGINPRSPAQLKDFFFQHCKFPEVWLSQKGIRKLSTNREALEKLESYLYARPFTNCILSYRDISKQLEVFETEIDPDGRFRTSYNVAGTETGRPSSSTGAFGTGGNAQNINPQLRYVFTADPGYRLCVIDLEQVEARDVGFFCGSLFDDWTFLDSCESGDLHSNNAKRIWPGLPWTGDPKKDRQVADRQFYREFSFRDMAKRGSHLSNYMGTAWTAARSLKVPLGIMEEFQARYCRGRNEDKTKGLPAIEPAFPCIPRWWQWTAEQLQTTHQLVTPFGRRRHFFGRPGDDTTLREAIAFLPQSTTADRMNLGLWRVWKHMPEVQLLAQTYDSITFQFPEKLDEDQIINQALETIKVELTCRGRSYIVPGEAKLGFNWGAEVTLADQQRALSEGKRPPRLNPGGLRKWKSGKKDERVNAIGFKRITGG